MLHSASSWSDLDLCHNTHTANIFQTGLVSLVLYHLLNHRERNGAQYEYHQNGNSGNKTAHDAATRNLSQVISNIGSYPGGMVSCKPLSLFGRDLPARVNIHRQSICQCISMIHQLDEVERPPTQGI